jgi:hypothetical protein
MRTTTPGIPPARLRHSTSIGAGRGSGPSGSDVHTRSVRSNSSASTSLFELRCSGPCCVRSRAGVEVVCSIKIMTLNSLERGGTRGWLEAHLERPRFHDTLTRRYEILSVGTNRTLVLRFDP